MIANQIAGIFSLGTPPIPPTNYESIATVTVGSGGSSTITFSSIPSTYKHLQIRAFAKDGSGSTFAAMFVKLNNVSGVRRHELYGTGSAVGAGNDPSSFVAYISGTTNFYGAAIIDILDANNTNKYKTTRGLSGVDNNGSGLIALTSGMGDSTSAVSSIVITANGSTFTEYSSFALYGITGA